eukprot:g2901.t1
MSLRTGGTFWGLGLCECFKMLNEGALDGANRMCVLIADGDFSGNTEDSDTLGSSGFPCANPDVAGRGKDGLCTCDYLWWYADSTGYTSALGYNIGSTAYVQEFVKANNVTTLGILADTDADITKMYGASSCDDVPQANSDSCDNFFKLNFTALSAYAGDIAANQRTLSTTTTTETREETTQEIVEETIQNVTQETTQVTSEEVSQETSTEIVEETSIVTATTSSSVSICSLDFLYGLIAFVPFFAYIAYRVVRIKAMSKTIRRELSEMIQSGELKSGDANRLAHIATSLLLPNNNTADIDYWICYFLHLCPCLKPLNKGEFQRLLGQTTIAL